jgi:hypothetical protein
LTHTCPAPSDFAGPELKTYGVPFRHTVRWSRVATVLDEEGVPCPDVVFSKLAREFVGFLGEHNMTGETASLFDLAAMQVYLPSADRVQKTFDVVWDKILEGDRRKLFVKTIHGPDFESEAGVVWGYMYLQSRVADNRYGSYFGWGIRFPQISNWWKDEDMTSHSHIFCLLGDDNNDLALDGNDVELGWKVLDGEIVKIRPIYEYPATSEMFGLELGRWASEGLQQICRMLPSVKCVSV